MGCRRRELGRLAVIVMMVGCGQEAPSVVGEPSPENAGPPPVESMPDPGRVFEPDTNEPETKPKPKPETAAKGHGFVRVQTIEGAETSAFAGFWNKKLVGDQLEADECRLDVHSAPPPPGDVSAGAIEISAGLVVTLQFLGPASGYPLTYVGPGVPETFFLVTAAGAAVPAFVGPIAVVSKPELTTAVANGIAGDSAFDVAWSPIQNATKIAVKLDGALATVVCMTSGASSHFLVPEARVREVAANPRTSGDCASCLNLSVVGISRGSRNAGGYAVSLEHESSITTPLELH